MRIQAALSRGTDDIFTIEDVELRDPRQGHVLVKMRATGICHTDLTIKASAGGGATPVILGHEGAGIVEAIGDGVDRISVGDHVVLTFASCGHCEPCLRRLPTYCDAFTALNSGGLTTTDDTAHTQNGRPIRGGFFGQSSFATHAVVAERSAIVVPPDLDLTVLAPFGCGIQTGAGSILNILRPSELSSVMVVGLGGVGLAALMAAVASGARRVIGVDPDESRREVARELGATMVLPPARDVVASVKAHTGTGASHAVDTTGNAEAIGQAFESLSKVGHLVLLGLGMPDLVLSGAALMSGGRSVTGSIEGDAFPEDFIPLLTRMHREGTLPVDRIVSEYAFQDLNQAISDMRSGAAIKPVLVFD